MSDKASKPIVSVVIPTYNRPGLTVEAVESVLAQTFCDFEIVVVDDGSIDDTAEVVRQINDPRFRLLQIDHTGMPGYARNRGVENARGTKVAFLDSDDLWVPVKLERQIAVMLESSFSLVHTRELWLRDGREISQAGQSHRREGAIFEDSLRKCIIGPSTVMIERPLFERLGGFREDLEIAEDYELWLRLTCREEVGYIDTPFTVKRAGHGEQLSEKYGHIELFRIRALGDLLDSQFFPEELAEMARNEMARKCVIYAAGARKRGRIKEADRYEDLSRRYGAMSF